MFIINSTFESYSNVKKKTLIKVNFFSFVSSDIKGFSCVELLNAGMRQSGVYYLQIRGTTYWFLKVYCEQEIADGGWTVRYCKKSCVACQ